MLHAVLIALAVPPTNLLPLGLLGFLLAAARQGWRRRAGRVLVGVCFAGLLLFSLPAVSGRLIASLEQGLAASADAGMPSAIVVLGGDVSLEDQGAGNLGAHLPHTDLHLGPLSLERVRAAAALHRTTGLPILVTGGVAAKGRPTIAALMADSLAQDFATPVRWQETQAADTWENASDSAAMLRADGIGTVYLVTQAWHMRRALIAFRHAGLAAIPAPTQRDHVPTWEPIDFLPRASAWLASYYAMHEWIGCAVYSLRG